MEKLIITALAEALQLTMWEKAYIIIAMGMTMAMAMAMANDPPANYLIVMFNTPTIYDDP